MSYVQIDVEGFCELVELTRENLTVLTNSCTDICNPPLHVKIYGPITLEGQWMDKHGNWVSEDLNDVKLIVHVML
jgi:hypothetical protein